MTLDEQEAALRAALKRIEALEADVAWLKTGYRVLDQPHPKSGEAP